MTLKISPNNKSFCLQSLLIGIVILLSGSFKCKSQEIYTDPTTKDSIIANTYPYVLPAWGQKVQERGFADQMQLPFGLNINYVNAFVDLEITEFELLLGNNTDLTGIINTETLNFQEVSGTTNGVNFRADAWVLPFLNIYALFSTVKGGTNVSLQPTWKDSTGEIMLQLPQFSSEVKFDALAYGVGTTLVFGWNRYFSSIDLNYSRTDTDLLKEQIGYLTLSARLGHSFRLSHRKKDMFIAPYLGMMYRDFVGSDGSSGQINLHEVFPDLDATFNERITNKIAANQELIDNPTTPPAQKLKLQAQNQALNTIQERVNDSGVFTTSFNYFIRKELIQSITFQFGFNFQLNKHWMLRGEYGVADSQRFLMTGLQYRFGIKKRSYKELLQ
ncbi:hypothetical protein [Mangrovimonas sp. TPBH4]|uniref:hypothetical protein n=1 Tax=Mangrovimonas sp. TPBH4 TaxID=1645914 RepID=UPI0006B655E3|nr:hypothetical protein [Mangrovimonas sp. TPBH4]